MDAAGGEGGESYYGECLRNHAARLGVYTVDGCTEFTFDASRTDLLHCTACGCHRNFHRKLAAGTNSDVVSGESREDSRRRRKRTKFTAEQKAKMAVFAEKIGWRLKRREESSTAAGSGCRDDDVARFCTEIGVSRHVFKVWLHNHKKLTSSATAAVAATASNVASSSTSNADGEGYDEPDISAGVTSEM